MMEVQHHSRICLLLGAVESGEFVHIDLNCKKKGIEFRNIRYKFRKIDLI